VNAFIDIHRDGITLAHETHRPELCGRHADFCHGDIHIIFKDERGCIEIVLLGQFDSANRHLLGAAAGRKQADSQLHEPHIGFGVGNNRIGMQAGFAAATHDQVVRCGHDRDLRVLDRHHRLLETFDRHGNFVVCTFRNCHNQQHQVGAG